MALSAAATVFLKAWKRTLFLPLEFCIKHKKNPTTVFPKTLFSPRVIAVTSQTADARVEHVLHLPTPVQMWMHAAPGQTGVRMVSTQLAASSPHHRRSMVSQELRDCEDRSRLLRRMRGENDGAGFKGKGRESEAQRQPISAV